MSRAQAGEVLEAVAGTRVRKLSQVISELRISLQSPRKALKNNLRKEWFLYHNWPISPINQVVFC